MRWLFVLPALLAAAPSGAQAPDNRFAGPVLAVHNRERALVGVRPLAWDAGLAAAAAGYARTLAARGRLEHASREARGGTGENLAMGTAGAFTPAALAQGWAAEKRYFRPGVFPDVSSTGNWRAVGHYTAMVWRNTTRVGCGTATGGGYLYLVCRYAPHPNMIGQRVY
jgi:hypothetical protein